MNVWQTILDHYGTQTAIARVCEVSQPSVHARIRDNAPVPAEWARAIHDDSRIPLSHMRPDLWPLSARASA